jgi:two-component sensor histidine kinase
VNLRVLITELTDSLPATLSIEPNRVRIKTDIEDITLDTKRAVPLALILNELVTNAVKYAHAGGGSVEIRIELHRWDKKVGLCVTDDGSGFPENIDPKTAESIGLSLIRMLAEQIDGELTFRKEKGTRICLEFTL